MPANLNKKEKQKRNDLEAELDKLEDMWDRIMEKGDDDFYETVQHHRQRQNQNEEQSPKRIRKRGKRM